MKISQAFHTLTTILLLFAYHTTSISAHSGRTDSSGCHNCYTDYCYGEYHCHNGGYAPAPVRTIYSLPTPTPIIIPSYVQGGATYSYNGKNAYSVHFDWDDISNSTGYSLAISKSKGSDPGPNTDTYVSEWTFSDIKPGKWYVNMKAGINGYWSQVSYWTIDVPPLPTRTPTPTITPTRTKTPTLTVTPLVTAIVETAPAPNIEIKVNLWQRIWRALTR